MSKLGMKSNDLLIIANKRELLRRKAKTDLLSFTMFLKWDYYPNWHHRLICEEIDDFIESKMRKKLMLFLPPQHGKSEIVSRMLPAYLLGRKPNTKIAGASYSIDLARSFNRDIQRYIDSEYYKKIFPNTFLSSKRVSSDSYGNWLRNTEEFEIVGQKGSYKSIGIMGGLAGRTVDFAIIDDPVKDALEANSSTYRERIWQWYLNVLETRLHNESKTILIMTRWHQDDLAGRLLKMEPESWDVVKIPSVMNNESVKEDPREQGEPLWPYRHGLQKLMALKKLSESTFSSLYQQNPIIEGGNKIKDEWFEYCQDVEVPPDVVFDLWIDGAYTKSTANDPSGLMVAGFSIQTNNMYIKHAHDAFMEMPELLKFVAEYVELHKLGIRSRIYIEPKASGKSLVQMLNYDTTLSAVEINNHLVHEGKEARCQTAAPKIESGKVVLIRGNWNDKFVHQLTGYPNVEHDEYIDLVGYACFHYFPLYKKAGVRRRN